jgi:mutator protein MutT
MNWPRLGVGGVVIHRDKVLLVNRKRPPSQGLWAIPGGKVEAGESLQQAVARELAEECGIEVEVGEVVHQFELIDKTGTEINFHYVVLDLQADYVSGEPVAGDDAAKVAWFDAQGLEAIPLDRNTLHLLQKMKFIH